MVELLVVDEFVSVQNSSHMYCNCSFAVPPCFLKVRGKYGNPKTHYVSGEMNVDSTYPLYIKMTLDTFVHTKDTCIIIFQNSVFCMTKYAISVESPCTAVHVCV